MNKYRDRRYYFLSGLPRSGSTLVSNVLAQNPRFRSDGITSRLADVLKSTCEAWDKHDSRQAWPFTDGKKRVLSGIFHAYYADSSEPVVFDKSRAWPANLEMVEMILQEKAKIICTVRDMRAIMSSWEKLRRKNLDAPSADEMPFELSLSVESRVSFWASSRSTTGRSYLALRDAVHRGFEDRMLFVDFDQLCKSPSRQMKRIYDFLGEKHFQHDFENIQQRFLERDPMPWMKGLHTIRQKLKAPPADWPQILGVEAAHGLGQMNQLWKNRI